MFHHTVADLDFHGMRRRAVAPDFGHHAGPFRREAQAFHPPEECVFAAGPGDGSPGPAFQVQVQ